MTIGQGNNVISGAADNHFKANLNFDNINDTAKNIANWSSNVTNCITHIPQDIKLELNNGTLTLKAGSKLYKPNGFDTNGNPKFDVVNITTDYNCTAGSTFTQVLGFFNESLSSFYSCKQEACFSGTTTPTTTGETNIFWYDTTNNIIKRWNGSSWITGWCFPNCVFAISSGSITSINQIFNGFGYIGSTAFVLPGVKGLLPNGRNADGSLKSIEFTVSSVRTVNTNSGTKNIALGPANITIIAGYYETETQPSEYYSLWYKPSENISYDTGVGTINATLMVQCCSVSCDSNGKITSFKPNKVFHALDYNDKETIVGWGMPDYETEVTGSQPGLGSWTKVDYDAFVVSLCSDPYLENYNVCVSPDNGTTSYIVGWRYDDVNANTQGTSFPFFIPAGWYFRNYCESLSSYHIYKLKGAN